MLRAGVLTLLYIVFLVRHLVLGDTGELCTLFTVVTFHYCNCGVSFLVFLALSLGLPTLLLITLAKELRSSGTTYTHYACMIASCMVMYIYDLLQDIAAARWDFGRNLDSAAAPMKYVMHLLLAPVFFVDIIYNLVVDRKRQSTHNLDVPRSDLVLFIIENTLVLIYITYAVGIFLRHYTTPGGPSLEQIVHHHRDYFTFQLLSCAVLVFIFALLFKRLASVPRSACA